MSIFGGITNNVPDVGMSLIRLEYRDLHELLQLGDLKVISVDADNLGLALSIVIQGDGLPPRDDDNFSFPKSTAVYSRSIGETNPKILWSHPTVCKQRETGLQEEPLPPCWSAPRR